MGGEGGGGMGVQVGEGWSGSVKACDMQDYLKQRLSVQASSFTPAFFSSS